MKKFLATFILIILALVVLILFLSSRVRYLESLSIIGAEGIQEGLTGSDSALNSWSKPGQSKKELEWTVDFLEEQSDKFIEAKCL